VFDLPTLREGMRIPRRSHGAHSTGSTAWPQRTDLARRRESRHSDMRRRRGSLNEMAQYTKHPVTAPPTAPERESTGHLLLRAYAIVVFIVAFAHTAVYNLVGEIGAGVVMVALTMAAAAIGVPMIARADPHPF